MARLPKQGPPGPTDRETGLWQGTSVARRLVSPDGMTVLVGRDAASNDRLTFKLAKPADFWFHVAGQPGSHVVVLNPDNLERLPRDTERLAADLAALYSKARHGGRVAVHAARVADVRKPRGMPPGKVTLSRYRTVQGMPTARGDETTTNAW